MNKDITKIWKVGFYAKNASLVIIKIKMDKANVNYVLFNIIKMKSDKYHAKNVILRNFLIMRELLNVRIVMWLVM